MPKSRLHRLLQWWAASGPWMKRAIVLIGGAVAFVASWVTIFPNEPKPDLVVCENRVMNEAAGAGLQPEVITLRIENRGEVATTLHELFVIDRHGERVGANRLTDATDLDLGKMRSVTLTISGDERVQISHLDLVYGAQRKHTWVPWERTPGTEPCYFGKGKIVPPGPPPRASTDEAARSTDSVQ
ncbi:MAG: hypothetical protein U0229_07200 [Anaeromyxobacter sp.]